MTPVETVQAFFRALEDRDLERLFSLTDESILYENVSLPPARGMKAFAKQMRGFVKISNGFEVRMHAIAANGGTVLTERVDILTIKGVDLEFWVCGTLEVRDGKITLWRDYFDWGQMTKRTLLALPRILARAATGA